MHVVVRNHRFLVKIILSNYRIPHTLFVRHASAFRTQLLGPLGISLMLSFVHKRLPAHEYRIQIVIKHVLFSAAYRSYLKLKAERLFANRCRKNQALTIHHLYNHVDFLQLTSALHNRRHLKASSSSSIANTRTPSTPRASVTSTKWRRCRRDGFRPTTSIPDTVSCSLNARVP